MRQVPVVVAAVVLNACAAGSGPGEAAAPVPTCQAPIEAPVGWQDLPVFHERAADHVGVRSGFSDALGRELHAFAGIPGEFGEGLPAAGEVRLATDVTVWLSGSGLVWVAEWDEGGPCDPRAVLGNGFERRDFLEVLEEVRMVTGPG